MAVIIDNIYLARPPAGLVGAPLVYEAPVEGGITRLMAILPAETETERIGPVRSVRPYFLDWAEEYDALLAHVGGSPEAMDRLRLSDLRSVNQMGPLGGYFWRDRGRFAPHNVYTSSELLATVRERVGERESDVGTGRPFKEGGRDGRVAAVGATRLSVDYSVSSYRVTWSYDEETNRYRRYQGRGQFTDEYGEQVAADNVIVQFTDVRSVDSLDRQDIRTVGDGSALLLRDGQAIEAEWSKESGGRTRFVDAESGEELPWNVGVTWIQVVGADAEVEYE
ncbi:DUF3048 domain-containing protein [Patescibacteria group bacterium]